VTDRQWGETLGDVHGARQDQASIRPLHRVRYGGGGRFLTSDEKELWPVEVQSGGAD